MSILLYISIILIIISVIFITIYINKILVPQPLSVYDYRVSKEYEKMFSQPSVWFGYQDFDISHKTNKLYKTN
jgi:uncharacterized protein YoxC